MFVYFVRYVVFSGLENPGTLASQTELSRILGESSLKQKNWDFPENPGRMGSHPLGRQGHLPLLPSSRTIHTDHT